MTDIVTVLKTQRITSESQVKFVSAPFDETPPWFQDLHRYGRIACITTRADHVVWAVKCGYEGDEVVVAEPGDLIRRDSMGICAVTKLKNNTLTWDDVKPEPVSTDAESVPQKRGRGRPKTSS